MISNKQGFVHLKKMHVLFGKQNRKYWILLNCLSAVILHFTTLIFQDHHVIPAHSLAILKIWKGV